MKIKKRYEIWFLLFFLLFGINSVLAIDVSFDIADSYEIGNDLEFDYTIKSEELIALTYTIGISCDNRPVGTLIPHTINVSENYSYSSTYSAGRVESDDLSSECTAFVYVIEPDPLMFNRTFKIIALKPLKMELSLCSAPDCGSINRFFDIGTKIFIDYSSDVDGLSLDATLTRPSGKKSKLTLPTSIKLEELGAYTLKVDASAPGYSSETFEELFSATEGVPTFKEKEFSSDSDKREDGQAIGDKLPYILLTGLVIALVFLIAFFIYIFLKRRSSNKQ